MLVRLVTDVERGDGLLPVGYRAEQLAGRAKVPVADVPLAGCATNGADAGRGKNRVANP